MMSTCFQGIKSSSLGRKKCSALPLRAKVQHAPCSSSGGRIPLEQKQQRCYRRGRVLAQDKSSLRLTTTESERTSSGVIKKLPKKDWDKYESLFKKYSSVYENQPVITMEQFQQLMQDLQTESPKQPPNWDDAFFSECSKYRFSEHPRRILSLLYDRVVTGKASRTSGLGILLSCLGMFAAFIALSLVGKYMIEYSFFAKFHALGAPFMLGSFGTLSVLVFGQPSSANLRIWNVVMGHMLGACCGVLAVKLLGYSSLAKAVAMASTLAAMLWTGAVHPPGGAIALLVVEDSRLQLFQHWYVLYPALFGAFVVYLVSFLTNKLKKGFGVP
jgi:hypothetical protein